MEGSGICQVKSNPMLNIKTFFCHMNKNKPSECQGHILHAILWFKTLYLLSKSAQQNTDPSAALHTGWRRLACSFNEVRVSLTMIFSSSKRIQRNRGPFIYRAAPAASRAPPFPPPHCQPPPEATHRELKGYSPLQQYPGRFSHQISQLKRIKSQTSPLL